MIEPTSKGFNYVLKSWVKQEEFEKNLTNDYEAALYGVQMNPYLQRARQYVFATVGQNRASIYECDVDGSIVLKQTYVDCCKAESFYCCCWSFQTNHRKEVTDHLLIVGGSRGIIRIVNVKEMKSLKSLKGHGSSINDLRTHPSDQNLIMSASKDHSIRLWNLKTDTLVAIFGGNEGHRDEVLSADFHLNLKYIVSCGMDHALKIWRLDTEKMKQAIIDSYKYNSLKAREPFKTAKDTFPMFTTRNIHRNYVDSVCWIGNFVLSKSCENSIVLWKPGKLESAEDVKLSSNSHPSDQSVTIIHKFDSQDNTIWFIRLTLNLRKKFLAVGNSLGVVYLWRIDEEDPTNSRLITLKHPKCYRPIRQVCFSLDARILIAISDDSSIWRWELED